jgi:hypothetical protein
VSDAVRPEARLSSAPPAFAVATFATTVAVSAALLFAVQPMLGKALLPPFGGGAAVWTAVMLFFQIGLLAGSALFHLTSTRLGASTAALLHVALAAIGVVLLPVAPSPRETGWGPTADVVSTLAAGYAPAVLVLGGNAAALQAWYARAAGAAPWWLYAVSNAGSLFGLAAYPLLLEPSLPLMTQGRLWIWAFTTCVAGLAVCAWLGQRGAGLAPPQATGMRERPGRWRRLAWVALAAVPSSLLLGVTEHVTVFVAPLPLLWILPLAAYLASWIIAFARPDAAERWGLRGVLLLLPFLLFDAVVPVISGHAAAAGVALHVAGLFAAALLAHGALALRRPAAAELTGFYLLLSLGGALGGVCNAVLAPALLDRPLEYPWALAALSLLPAMGRGRTIWILWGVVAALMAATPLLVTLRGRVELDHARDFYGALLVRESPDSLALAHGRTVHGFQWRDPARRLEPSGYYHRQAGAGRLIATMERMRNGNEPMQGLVVGLGVGAMACYGSDRLRLDFVEISPVVVEMARRWFSFLRDCGEPLVELGDGRLRLAARPPGSLDLIAIDAYSGASIPVHMATAEATALFLDRLRPGGALAVHVSSRNFDLLPLVAAAASAAGARTLALSVEPEGFPSTWLAITRDVALLEQLEAEGWWAPTPAARPWRDDRWDLLSALRWRAF